MKNQTFYKFEIDGYTPGRLDQIIASQLPEYSRTRIKHWINGENITVNGKICSPKDKIKKRSIIEIRISNQDELDVVPENIPIDILFEDDDLIIIKKNKGMVTHIAPANYTGTLQNAILYSFPELKTVPRAGIIHRLDKNTTGLLIIGRNIKSYYKLTKQMSERKIFKQYLALCKDIISKNTIVNKKIGRHKINRKKMTVASYGKEAISKVYVKEKYKKSSLIEVNLITGRTHQIRVHLSYIGHPILGDKLYGFKVNNFNYNKNLKDFFINFEGHLLHAKYLAFKHPSTNKEVSFTCDEPDEFKKVKMILRKENEKS
ncbi:MAG: RNA pseudouridine synthase [Gammaproteobacteria bacterium]|nr:RNA pseudouridine synthase [Gammaproteobacteria bacterium]|tara:strand:- start:456 stop:1406 length:951 start_codon:yes stop_codon:yes gene_type:complete